MFSAVLWIALEALPLLPAPGASQSGIELRFHHFHVSVPDPAAAMREAGTRLEGSTQTILQGHGPGVRIEGCYLVFDREGSTTAPAPEVISDSPGVHAHATDRYEQARRWADAHGLRVVPSAFSLTAVAEAVPTAWIPSIAFSTRQHPDVVTALQMQGVKPFHITEETAKYRLPSGLVLEIVVETDRPDTHWCPMHPDVRAPGTAKCRRCGMDLVPIPEPVIGEYALDVDVHPIPGRAGASGVTLAVREPGGGALVTRFLEVHERRFHLFIINRALTYFNHVHPEQREDGTFVLRTELPPDHYMLIADFLPAGGTPQMVHRSIVTPGSHALFSPPPELRAGSLEQVVGGLRVRLEADSIVALRRSPLRFVIFEASGEPARGLEPYLGAAAHLLIVNMDLTSAIHGHPEGNAAAGPVVTFDPLLPSPGPYRLWLQFQQRGRVVTVPFVIEAAAPMVRASEHAVPPRRRDIEIR